MSSIVQNQQMLCGDEIKAAILDLGSYKCRFGTAGQDLPRHIFRSDVGISEENINSNISSSICDKKYTIGDSSLRCVKESMEVSKPFNTVDGNNEINWDLVEIIIKYGLEDCMRADPNEYPLMFAENYFDTVKKKEKLLEICFEKFNSPAVFTSSNATLSSFSTGKRTSLVVDIGATSTRITPVVDGYSMKKANIVTNRGGNWLDGLIRKEIEINRDICLKPWYEIGSKIYPTPSDSFRNIHIHDIICDIKHWMCFVPYKPIETVELRNNFFTNLTLPCYSLPDGTSIYHSESLCSGPEMYFMKNTSINNKRSHDSNQNSNPDYNVESLQELVISSVSKCDVDARRELLSNILLVGGGSMIDGIGPRLQHELQQLLPISMKAKITTPLAIERQNSAWIGGSILAICGSFQQLWISNKEYAEEGNSIINDRLIH